MRLAKGGKMIKTDYKNDNSENKGNAYLRLFETFFGANGAKIMIIHKMLTLSKSDLR